MKIKVMTLLVIKEKIGYKNDEFRVKDLIVNTDSESLENKGEKSDILKCLKSCLKYNKNTIDYNEINELVNSNNIIGNNFWNEDNFEDICRFEYRDYFDFSECKFKYI